MGIYTEKVLISFKSTKLLTLLVLVLKVHQHAVKKYANIVVNQDWTPIGINYKKTHFSEHTYFGKSMWLEDNKKRWFFSLHRFLLFSGKGWFLWLYKRCFMGRYLLSKSSFCNIWIIWVGSNWNWFTYSSLKVSSQSSFIIIDFSCLHCWYCSYISILSFSPTEEIFCV